MAFGTLFPVYLNTLSAYPPIDPALLEMARSYGVSGRELFRHVVLPARCRRFWWACALHTGHRLDLADRGGNLVGHQRHWLSGLECPRVLQTDIVVLSILLYALLGKVAGFAGPLAERAGCSGILGTSSPRDAVQKKGNRDET